MIKSSGSNICFIGGDKRQKYAAETLAQYYGITASGECFADAVGINYLENPIKALHSATVIVLPLPALKCESVIDFPRITEFAHKNKALILGGLFSTYMKDMMDALDITYFDYYDDESFTIRNAYLTAEGALNIAMNELEQDIKSSRFAIIGYGRIGSALGDIISALKGNATVFARREEILVLATERALQGKYISTDDELDFDIIFNTVPSRVITNEQLLGLDSKTLLIELASAPGGFDPEIAEQSGLKVIKAGGLPGKYAPKSAGKAVAESLLKLLKREAIL